MILSERIESCIKELKENNKLLELERLIGELEAENERLRREKEQYRREATGQRQESEKILNIFLEQIKDRERASAYEQETEALKAENIDLKAKLEDAKSWTEAKERYDAEYKKLLGIGEILGDANNEASQKVLEQQKNLEELMAEKQKAEEELFRLRRQTDEAKKDYNNTRQLIEELMAGMRGLDDVR